VPPAAAKPAPPPARVEQKIEQKLERKKVAPPVETPRPRAASAKPGPARSSGWPPVAIAVLVAIALVVIFIATPLFRSKEAAESPAATSPAAPAEPAPAPVDAKPTPAPPAPKPAEPPPPAPRAEKKSAGAIAGPAPVLVTAELCRDLSTDDDWECVPPRDPVRPGPLFFYTRLKSPVDTTVQHRWYRGDRLRQVVELRVRANTTGGYRTYSRNTVNDYDQAEWRVELRTTDGTLLKETRFTVR
jgi:hypothetical protein